MQTSGIQKMLDRRFIFLGLSLAIIIPLVLLGGVSCFQFKDRKTSDALLGFGNHLPDEMLESRAHLVYDFTDLDGIAYEEDSGFKNGQDSLMGLEIIVHRDSIQLLVPIHGKLGLEFVEMLLGPIKLRSGTLQIISPHAGIITPH